MTREKDSNLLAEAYKNILNENSVMEYLNSLDPETLNILGNALAMGAGLGIVKFKEIVDQKKQEKSGNSSSTAKIGNRMSHQINPDGTPTDPTDLSHDISSNLRRDASALKGQKMRR